MRKKILEESVQIQCKKHLELSEKFIFLCKKIKQTIKQQKQCWQLFYSKNFSYTRKWESKNQSTGKKKITILED